MTRLQANQPTLIPKTNTEAKDRLTLEKAIRAAAAKAKPLSGGFRLDPTASIEEICQDIREYALANFMVVSKIRLANVDDPHAAKGNQVRANLVVTSNLKVITRSLSIRLDGGMAPEEALKEALILLDVGNGAYAIVDGNHRFFALSSLGLDTIPKAAVLPKGFFRKLGISMDIFQIDCNPVPENAGMKLKKVRESIEDNWNGILIQGDPQRAINWVKNSNLCSADDKSIEQMVSAIEKRVKKIAKQAKVAAATKAASKPKAKPNFFEWNGGKTDLDKKAPFHTHTFIAKHCAKLIKGKNYYSFNCSDGPMINKIMGGYVTKLFAAGTLLKDLIIAEFQGKPISRKGDILFCNVNTPADGTMEGLTKNRKTGLKNVLKYATSGFQFEAVYFKPQAAGIEDLTKPILAWTKKNGKTSAFQDD